MNKDFDTLLDLILEPQILSCVRFLFDNEEIVYLAPGSRGAHHNWEGGYIDHLCQTMNHFLDLYHLAETRGHMADMEPNEQFTISDGLVVLFLHDIEKPFLYTNRVKFDTKKAKELFRRDLIRFYSFNLNANQENALKFVEGVRDEDYKPGFRVDKPLAVLCHAADNYSARVQYASRKAR